MRMYDIIQKKRDGYELNKEEICFFVNGFTSGEVKDYQISALMMAIYFKGMTDREITDLTLCMAASGDELDLSDISGYVVDKHSTGGVGDKTTLIIGPIVAACGGKIAKMSGRGLGHTGGTVDKLESINGFNTALSPKDFMNTVNNIGICVVGQTGNLAPADKKLYALRDVTATVDSIPLIASSIMSKKLAAGADGIVLDVKTGSGAFMKDLDKAILLAKKMSAIGKSAGRDVIAVITNMDSPLGNKIGNNLEVIEACDVLKGKGPKDITEISLVLSANMLKLATKCSFDECYKKAENAIKDGSALNKLKEMVTSQGGDAALIDNNELFKKPKRKILIKSKVNGFISHMDTETIGKICVVLGAGRNKKDDIIDFSAGIILSEKTGDNVKIGDTLATFQTDNDISDEEYSDLFFKAIKFSDSPVKESKLIIKTID